MAMKKAKPVNKEISKKRDDNIIYSITLVLSLVCLIVVGIMRLYYYSTEVQTMADTLAALVYIAPITAALAVVSFVLLAVLKPKAAKLIMLLLGLLFAAAAVSTFLVRRYWISAFPFLYLFFVGIGVLFVIFQLYQREFFLISLLTFCSGSSFYLFSQHSGSSVYYLAAAVLALLIAACACLTAFAGKHAGTLPIGSRRISVYTLKDAPLCLYITCAVWAVCLMASVLLGSTFAYYCMFAAIAYELVAACYFTIKLT